MCSKCSDFHFQALKIITTLPKNTRISVYAYTCMDNPDILSTHTHTCTQKITTGLSQLLHNTDQQNLPLCEEKALIIQRERALHCRPDVEASVSEEVATFIFQHFVISLHFRTRILPVFLPALRSSCFATLPRPPSVIFSRHQFNSGRSATSSLYCANPHSLGSY